MPDNGPRRNRIEHPKGTSTGVMELTGNARNRRIVSSLAAVCFVVKEPGAC